MRLNRAKIDGKDADGSAMRRFGRKIKRAAKKIGKFALMVPLAAGITFGACYKPDHCHDYLDITNKQWFIHPKA